MLRAPCASRQFCGIKRTMKSIFLRSIKWPAVALLAPMLGGCAALTESDAEYYRKQCISLGIAPDSPNFENCILQQQRLEEERVQHYMDREALEKHDKRKK